MYVLIEGHCDTEYILCISNDIKCIQRALNDQEDTGDRGFFMIHNIESDKSIYVIFKDTKPLYEGGLRTMKSMKLA